MKTTLIALIALFLSTTLFAFSELEWVDQQIEAIKPPRKGVEILNIEDPFVFLQKSRAEVKKDGTVASAPQIAAPSLKPVCTDSKISKDDKSDAKKDNLSLSTIINSSALIDGNWYKVSDKISSYTVVDISKTTVTLKKGDKELILSTYSKTPTLKFKNK
ncbi:MAG: hypothetical protein PHO62_10715 [Sulfurimonas sp.]|uniref:hypothetical protein n=1 Tax=Sulfurimonas sp. TaxID=2022749 RepID=UPI002608C7C8|nr:hypothetical protein [Sulfurimonas sp.]MDD5373881.1 hypothetical protein [Sulfurimonas sp.]